MRDIVYCGLGWPSFWHREIWRALDSATAEFPLSIIFSSCPTWLDSSSTFELVDWINLFAFSRAEHSLRVKTVQE
uniref:Uncharacterized protein LOC105127834 n=1 Tax=Rhizophora mucronata TaxID=61149 RepID=A0A2P2J7D6_RHIMU